MLYCGDRYNNWVVLALQYLPEKILLELIDKIAIFSTSELDGCRIARVICNDREIILLSERILPKKLAEEDHADVRYFIFVVLHEIAHVFKNHRSPLYDNLSYEDNCFQENEANEMAFHWFNEHVKKRNNQFLKPLTYEEIDIAKENNQNLMNKLYEGT